MTCQRAILHALIVLTIVSTFLACRENTERSESSKGGSDEASHFQVNRSILPEWHEYGTTATVTLGGTAPIRLVRIKSGSLVVPLTEEELGDQDSTGTTKILDIESDYWIGVTEITQGQWLSMTEQNPSYFLGEDLPVHGVAWDRAAEYCRKLSLATGREFLLPTTMEWEYACRAGTTTRWYWGENPGPVKVHEWFYENAGAGRFPPVSRIPTVVRGYEDFTAPLGLEIVSGIREKHPHRVGTKQPNPWGLFDMLGNVEEWTRTSCDAPDAPQWMVAVSKSGFRFRRGGAYYCLHPDGFLPGWQVCDLEKPVYVDPTSGFRIVCSIETSEAEIVVPKGGERDN